MSIGRIQEFLWTEDINTDNVKFVKDAGKIFNRFLTTFNYHSTLQSCSDQARAMH